MPEGLDGPADAVFELLALGLARRARGRSPRAPAPASTARRGSPRAGAGTPSCRDGAMTDRSPFCPPAEPRARRRRAPSGRSMSSTTTQSSEGSTLCFLQRARTASPEAFMYVCGSARSTGSVPTLPRPTREEHSRDADPDSFLRRQRLDDAEPRVVPGLLVVVPGISEADDRAQRLLLLFLLLLLVVAFSSSAPPSSSVTALPFFRTSGSAGSAAAPRRRRPAPPRASGE